MSNSPDYASDESNDDEQQLNNNNNDDNMNTDDHDNSNDNNDNDNDTSEPQQRRYIKIKSDLFNEPQEIPISVFQDIRRAGQLKHYIDANIPVNSNIDIFKYYIVKAATSKGIDDLEDDDIIDLDELQGLILAMKQVTFNVIDRTERYTELQLDIKSTVNDVRELLPYDIQKTIDYFTYCGERVQENNTLYDIGITSGDLYNDPDNQTFDYDNINFKSCLVGQIRLYIKDDNLNLEVPVDLYDNSSLADVYNIYSNNAKRKIIPGSTLLLQGDINPLTEYNTLYQQRIVDETLLYINTPEYTVEILEQLPMTNINANRGMTTSMTDNIDRTQIVVNDYWTVRKLKEQYNIVKAGKADFLGPNDKLYYRDDSIDDKRTLYSYSIIPDTTNNMMPQIQLKREELNINKAVYICANCGNDVYLKRSDAVQCQTCFERILYKKPKAIIPNYKRQYICR